MDEQTKAVIEVIRALDKRLQQDSTNDAEAKTLFNEAESLTMDRATVSCVVQFKPNRKRGKS